MPFEFQSCLGPTITDYIALKETLGRRYFSERHLFRQLDNFLFAKRAPDLTPRLFASWCQEQTHLKSGVLRHRMRSVRNLCLYRRRTQPSCFVPDESLFPANHQPVTPYIYKEAEVFSLLAATGSLGCSEYPLRPQVARLGIALLYMLGLRRSELVHLTVADYNRRERTLLIRNTKFRKSRLLPLSDDANDEIEKYLKIRRASRRPLGEEPLIWAGCRTMRGYTSPGFGQLFRILLRKTDIRTPSGEFPRLHDMRHTFAATALLRWYRMGVEPQTKLPLLAIYMGHVSVVSTEYYLHFIDDIASSASARFASRCGGLIAARKGERSRL